MNNSYILTKLQIINWGVFDGLVTFDYTHGEFVQKNVSTVVSGDSGSGKSTALDAYVVLTTPTRQLSLNVAADKSSGNNDRSVGNYMRGATEEVESAEGSREIPCRRSDDSSTWSAVSATYYDTIKKEKVTVAAFFFMPRGERNKLERTSLIKNGDIDLTLASTISNEVFSVQNLQRVYGSDIFVTRKIGDFFAKLDPMFGYNNQVRLIMEKIRSGSGGITVDKAVKEMILEEPETISIAQNVIETYNNRNETFLISEKEERKKEALEEIEKLYLSCNKNQEEMTNMELILAGDQESLLSAYIYQSLQTYVLNEKENLIKKTDDLKNQLEEEELKAINAEMIYDSFKETYDNEGGKQITLLESEIDRLTTLLEMTKKDRKRVHNSLSSIKINTPENEEEFSFLQKDATDFLLKYENNIEAKKKEKNDLSFDFTTKENNWKSKKEEIDDHKKRGSVVSSELNKVKEIIQESCQIPGDRLTYLNEIIDMKDEDDAMWRNPISIALKSHLQVLLVDSEYEEDVRRVLETNSSLKSANRFTVDFIDVKHKHYNTEVVNGNISGLLQYKEDSLFADYVKSVIIRNDYTCVNDVEELNRVKFGLTISGQIKNKNRASQGKIRNLVPFGFSDKNLIKNLEMEYEKLGILKEEAKRKYHVSDKECETLDKKKAAFSLFLETASSFKDIDVVSKSRKIRDLKEKIDELNNSSSRKELKLKVKESRECWLKLVESKGNTSDAINKNQKQIQLYDKQIDIISKVDSSKKLTEKQQEIIENKYNIIALYNDKNGDIDEIIKSCSNSLKREKSVLKTEYNNLTADIIDKQEKFAGDFWDREKDISIINISPSSLSDTEGYFLAELNRIRELRLDMNTDNSLNDLIFGTSQALAEFTSKRHEYLSTVNERQNFVNSKLSEIEYGKNGGVLSLEIKKKETKQTKELLNNISVVLQEIQSSNLRKLSRLDKKSIRSKLESIIQEFEIDDRRKKKLFIDARESISSEAKLTYKDKSAKIYKGDGSLSGGESQEFAATILASALLYHMSNGINKEKFVPKNRTVMFDEAFGDTDVESTKRAINNVKKLGFSLILHTVVEKQTTIEKASDYSLYVKKKSDGSSFVFGRSLLERKPVKVEE